MLPLIFAAQSYAASISFSIATDTGVASFAGSPLDSTYLAYIGTYTGGALTPESTYAEISANFSTLYSGAFASGDAAGANGYFIMPDTAFTDAQGFANRALYVLFTNGSDQNALITGFGNIPADAAIPNSAAFAIDSGNVGSLTLLVGTYDPAGANLAGQGGNIVLSGVPEASTALLGALGALGLLRRRRA